MIMDRVDNKVALQKTDTKLAERVEITSMPSPLLQKKINDKRRLGSENKELSDRNVVIDIGMDDFSKSKGKGNWNLSQPDLYLNRELTWLNFNRRVLFEAENGKNPLLERVKFLAIVSSNTDDFFMKRIGGFKQLIEAKVQELSVDGRTPAQQLQKCYVALNEIEEKKSLLYNEFLSLLKKEKIILLTHNELTKVEIERLRDYFVKISFHFLHHKVSIQRIHFPSYQTCPLICWLR